MFFSRWKRSNTYMRRDAGEEGGREFSYKMPRTMSNLPDFPRHPFLYVHRLYTKSMGRIWKWRKWGAKMKKKKKISEICLIWNLCVGTLVTYLS